MEDGSVPGMGHRLSLLRVWISFGLCWLFTFFVLFLHGFPIILKYVSYNKKFSFGGQNAFLTVLLIFSDKLDEPSKNFENNIKLFKKFN